MSEGVKKQQNEFNKGVSKHEKTRAKVAQIDSQNESGMENDAEMDAL